MNFNPGRTSVRAATFATIALLGSIGLTACGSSGASDSSGKSVKIDVGGGQSITVQGPPHIAYFMAGSSVPYLKAREQGIETAVKAIPGASVASFDPQYSAPTQLAQIQNAIASKKYNAFIVDANDGNALCNVLTKQAPAANIAVVDVAGPLCGRTANPKPEDHWAPGTVAIIDNHSIDNTVEYLEDIIKDNPGPQQAIVLTGPALHPLTSETDAALKTVEAKYPDFKVVAESTTDFSVLQGQQKMQSLLASNPDATLFLGVFSDITQGASTAVQQAGMTGKIKLYDEGGSPAIVKLVQSGAVAATVPGYPLSCGKAAVGALEAAFDGKPGPRVILNDGGPVPADSPTGLTVLDKANIDSFKPEGPTT